MLGGVGDTDKRAWGPWHKRMVVSELTICEKMFPRVLDPKDCKSKPNVVFWGNLEHLRQCHTTGQGGDLVSDAAMMHCPPQEVLCLVHMLERCILGYHVDFPWRLCVSECSV